MEKHSYARASSISVMIPKRLTIPRETRRQFNATRLLLIWIMGLTTLAVSWQTSLSKMSITSKLANIITRLIILSKQKHA